MSTNNLTIVNADESAGEIFYVNNSTSTLALNAIAGSNGNDGKSPQRPFGSLDYAIGQCYANRGDVIFVMSAHSETPTSSIAIDVAGVKIIGLGIGTERPTFTGDSTTAGFELFTVDADDVYIENIRVGATTGTNSMTDLFGVATGTNNFTLKNCEITQGIRDLLCISYDGTGLDNVIEGNTFIVSANGPDSAIRANSGVLTRLKVKNCVFDGNSTTNAWDLGAIDSDQSNVRLIIEDNKFFHAPSSTHAIDFSGSTTGVIANNYFFGMATEGRGLDGGGCMLVNNQFENEAKTEAHVATAATGQVMYVDSTRLGGSSGNGFSPSEAFITLAEAVSAADNDAGDVIYIMPSHTETITTTTVTVAKDKLSIIGLHPSISPATEPTFIVGDTIYGLTISGAQRGLSIKNINFGNPTAVALGAISAAGGSVLIENCRFSQDGTNGANPAITTGSGLTDFTLRDNTFILAGADAATSAVYIGHADSRRAVIENNRFIGHETAASSWDNGALFSDQATFSTVVRNNVFINIKTTDDGRNAINFTAATTGAIYNNVISVAAVGFGIDPGSCSTHNNTVNYETDGRAVPFPFYSPYDPVLGYKVTKSAADALNGATVTLFTIATGRVLVTHLSMENTTAGATDTAANAKFISNPTVGTDKDMCAALAVGTSEVGAVWSITGEPATAMQGGVGGGSNAMISPWIVPEGTIDVNTTADTNLTNSATQIFEIWYKPLDVGATVTST